MTNKAGLLMRRMRMEAFRLFLGRLGTFFAGLCGKSSHFFNRTDRIRWRFPWLAASFLTLHRGQARHIVDLPTF